MNIESLLTAAMLCGALTAGCAVDNAGSDSGQNTATLQAAQNDGELKCYRNPPPLPGGGNIEGFLLDCWNAGGQPICSGATPMCCVTRGGARHCSYDVGDVTRASADMAGSKPEVAPILNPPGFGPELVL